MMTFSGAHQKQLGWGDRERGVQATARASLLLALLPKKIFVCVCVLAGLWWCFCLIYLFFPQTHTQKVNNASVPPEVLNSVLWKEERKNTTPLPK